MQLLIKAAAVTLIHCDQKLSTRVFRAGTVRLRLRQHRWPWSGAFTNYLAEKSESMWRVPEQLSLKEATSIGWAVRSGVGTALWWMRKLPGMPETLYC